MARDWARNLAAAACLVFLGLVLVGPAPAWAQFEAGFGERYALVIGNSDYSHVKDLPNTARDAEAMAEALEALRFTVFKGTDLAAGEFERLVEEFEAAAAEADTVVFYYAGHGFQLNGLNHLAPVDAVLRDRARIDEETFLLDEIVAKIHRRQRQTIVFLDACRNNPLPPGARDGTGSGLAQVGTGDGIFVAFATQPGNVSYDGTGKNSPFTEALLTHIGKPNRNISSLMIDVRNEVSDRTLGRQVPWDQSSLRADFFFNPAPAPQQVAAREPARGGLVIGRPGGGGDMPAAGPAPRQSPLTIGPAPARPSAASERTDPAAQPGTPAAPVKPRARPEQMTAAVTSRATPDTVAPGPSARATLDTIAPASGARATPGTAPAAGARASRDTVAPAASARATPDKVAALATGPERPETVTAAPTSRAQAPATVTRTAALAQPETVTDAAGSAPVERLRPDREWFPDDAAPAPQDEGEEQKTAALDPAEPLESETEEPDEPLIDERELARSIQSDLARLGCYRMSVDGVWGPGSRNSLAQFYREKGEGVPSLEPSTDVLAMLQDESGTVCAPPKRAKTPQVASPPKKKAPARAKAQPAPQRPTASAPQAPAATPKTPKILGF